MKLPPAVSEPYSSPTHLALLGQANSVHLQRWAIGLAERGLRVSVITQQGAEALPLPSSIELHTLPFRGQAGYALNAPALRRLLTALQPDLLHAHYASGYGTTAMVARWHPWLLSVWGADVYDFPAKSPLHRALLRRNLQTADRLASTSVAMAEQVRRIWPEAGPIDITPFGVDTEWFSPGAVAPRRGLTIGTVKSLAPKYGVDTLIQAFARLVRTQAGADARLLIVGGGPQRAALESLVAGLGLTRRVEFVGAVSHSEVPRWLRAMDIYVAASRDDSESFGVAVIEASACAIPVVVSDAGGLPEVVEDEITGLVVPRNDVSALERALASLTTDPDRRHRLGAAGRQRVIERYRWPTCVDGMLAVYRHLLS